MGKSKKSSCLKILTCSRGEEVVDDDDPVTSPQSKVSSEKRRWSFRKKSAEHQVQSSAVISEIVLDSFEKESSEFPANNIQCPKNSTVSFSEKSLIKGVQFDIPQASPEKSLANDIQLEIPQVESKLIAPHVEEENSTNDTDHEIKEYEIVKIQAFIRGYLVRRELPKLKNVVKLQAAIRGHLVRRQAAGTLRCAQAIIKMQLLIRARRARVHSKKLDEQEGEQIEMDNQSLEKRDYLVKPEKKYNSSKSQLSTGFARQLLEYSTKTKPIYISCDPSKSDSAWKWLGRWMAATSEEEQQKEPKCQDKLEQFDCEFENNDVLAELSISSSLKVAEDVKTKNPTAFEFRDSTCLVKDDQDQSQHKYEDKDVKNEKNTKSEAHIENYVSEKDDIAADSSEDYKMLKTKDLIIEKNPFSHEPRVQNAASECGTEISISSTLDSPDRSETEGGEIVLELGSLEKDKRGTSGNAGTSIVSEKTEEHISTFDHDLTQQEKLGESDKKLENSTTSVDVDLQSQAENSTNVTTEHELDGTPSSQKSVNAKKKKREIKKPDGKLISQIAKKSSSIITKDSNNVKRRNSSGIDKTGNVDQEPRMSTSDSLPSYMQATESARAKAHASLSPKSSPDLNKENHVKKRHSLPIANGKQGSSPRMQKSPSQSHTTKGSATHSPHTSGDRRWQR